ncbi:MAG: zeta toxin family protein [Elusimicrobiota bacterium]|nr:zeta toxin family protein [Elusimicrobiota bacterium]
MDTKNNVYVVAGPNGSGKTTFAREFLPNYAMCSNFVNADLIAQGLSPFNPREASIKAGKLVLSRINDFSKSGADFGFETTLSGRTHLRLLHRLEERGYHVHIFFLWVPSSDLSLLRVKNRAADGGHNVPAVDVCRRFKRSITNFFEVYMHSSTTWMLFDTSGTSPVLAAKGKNGALIIENADVYARITGKI